MLSRHRCKDAKSKTRAQLWPCHTVNSCPLTNCSLCSKNCADLLHFQLLKRKKDAISFFSQTSAIAGIQEENKNYRHSRAQLCNSRAQLCNDTFASASFKHNLKSNRLSDTQNIFAKAKYKGHIYNVSVNCSAGKSVRKIALNDLNLITFMF